MRIPDKFRFNNDPLKIGLKSIPARRNPKNTFCVFTVHYSQHPKTRGPDGEISDAWYSAERAGVSGPIWDREMELKYHALGGELIWPTYNEEIHVIEPIPLDERWFRFRFIDYGHRNPTCCLWITVSFDGTAYIYREWYHPTFSDMQSSSASKVRRYTLQEHSKIIQVLSNVETYNGTLIDPQAGEMTFASSSDGKTVIDKLRDSGLHCTKARKASEGLDSIEVMFREKKLFIFNTCKNTIAEIEDYRFKEFSESMQASRNLDERPIKKNDHACNCIKFFGNHRLKVTPRPHDTRNNIPREMVREVVTDSVLSKKDIEAARKKFKNAGRVGRYRI